MKIRGKTRLDISYREMRRGLLYNEGPSCHARVRENVLHDSMITRRIDGGARRVLTNRVTNVLSARYIDGGIVVRTHLPQLRQIG